MRITANIDADAFLLVHNYMRARRVRLGKALSELVRKGIDAPRPTRRVNGLLVVDLRKDSPRVTTRQVRNLL